MALYYAEPGLRGAVRHRRPDRAQIRRGRRSPSVAAQFVDPLTIIGFAIYVLAALLLHRRAEEDRRFRWRSRRSRPAMRSSRCIAHLLWNEPFGWPQLGGIVLIGGGILLIHQH